MNKTMKNLSLALSLATLTFTFVSCGGGGGDNKKVNVAVTGITLNKAAIFINVGSTESVTATIQPSNATNKNVSWGSTDLSVATGTFSGLNAVVRGVKSGMAVVQVETVDGKKTAECLVFVSSPSSNYSEIYKAGYEIVTGTTAERRATLWTTGIPQCLSDVHSEAISFHVSDNDIYVAGYEQAGRTTEDQRATLWINGRANHLSETHSSADTVFVSDNKVYVLGHEYVGDISYATLWLDGVTHRLNDFITR